MKKFFTIGLLGLLAFSSNAQTEDYKWAVGVHGGVEQYKGELGSGFYAFGKQQYGMVGLTVSRYLAPHFDVTIHTTYGAMGYNDKDTSTPSMSRHNLFQANGQLVFNILKEKHKLRPYIFAGLGYMRFTGNGTKIDNMSLPSYGLGLKYQVTPRIALQLQNTFFYSDWDHLDNNPTQKFKDHYMQLSLGAVFNFGKAKDTDMDGLSDSKDKCPNVAGLEKFMGCPDTDGDGIPDKDDTCPNVAGLANFNGCPDTDGDGVTDAEDACPKIAGLADFKGCPDTDGDGIADKDDDCPKIAGLADFKGCPDSDGDGVQNIKDDCPQVKGVIALNGCPDADGDGIADKDDACPNLAGIKENKGCPAVKEETTKILDQALHGVKFESGKDIIRSSSNTILNNVVKIMEDNPSYKLQIDGHTDSSGDDAKNMDLSKRRAAAVKKYLTDKGIDASRLNSNGFGETKPVADNGTAKGREENRRVELKVKF